MEPTVAVVGASGLIGRELLDLLETRQLAPREIRLLGSVRTAGGEVEHEGKRRKIALLGPSVFEGVDIAFFAAGPSVSSEYAPLAAGAGVAVVDLTSRFRLDPEIPLVVPEVNADAIAAGRGRGIVASPSGTAIGLSVVLAPLAAEAGLARVIVSTYQGAAGAGRRGMGRLSRETLDLLSARGRRRRTGRRPVAFNCVPEIGAIEPGGATTHELQVAEEIRKVLGRPELPMAATAVRVPGFFGSAMAVTLETVEPLSAEQAREVLRTAPGVLFHDDFPTPAEVVGSDATHVGRLRSEPVFDNGLGLWVALDNIRKGGALNAVEIAEILIRDYL
jgi:aspartate-semialdehyde dehydrogenase